MKLMERKFGANEKKGGEKVSKLISLLRHPKMEERFKASEELVKIGKHAIEELRRLLDDEDWSIRWRVAYTIGRIGEKHKLNDEDVERIGKLTKDPDQNVRVWALKALKKIKFHKDVILKYLIEATKDDDPEVRKEAVGGLSHYETNEAVERLEQLLEDEDEEVRTISAWALGMVGNHKTYEILIDRLKNEESEKVAMMIKNAIFKLRKRYGVDYGYIGHA